MRGDWLRRTHCEAKVSGYSPGSHVEETYQLMSSSMPVVSRSCSTISLAISGCTAWIFRWRTLRSMCFCLDGEAAKSASMSTAAAASTSNAASIEKKISDDRNSAGCRQDGRSWLQSEVSERWKKGQAQQQQNGVAAARYIRRLPTPIIAVYSLLLREYFPLLQSAQGYLKCAQIYLTICEEVNQTSTQSIIITSTFDHQSSSPLHSSHKLRRHLRNRRQIPDPPSHTLHINSPKHTALRPSSRPRRPISFATVVPAGPTTITPGMPAPRIPSSSSTPAHLRQINAKLPCKLVQHAAADERHDDREENLVRVAARVVHQVAPQLA